MELFLPYASFFIGIYCLIIFFTIHKIPQTLIAIGKTASFSMAAISLFYGVIWIGWLLLKEGLSAFVVHDIGAIFFVLVIFFSRLAPAFFWYEVGKYFRNES
ncbi:hypothetical protein HYT17_02825 [Candidatus Microgenomates bacterium]|nr:hypothetical protein [Candidatus Microgenomates bacterium]